MPEDGEHDRNM